jgi:hypothetical protein
LENLILEQIPKPSKERPYRLFGMDCTSNPRPFTSKLEDIKVVYQPNPILNNKPVTIGHEYSLLAYLPEKNKQDNLHWIVPIDFKRVTSTKKGHEVGIEQFIHFTQDPNNPNQLDVCVADSKYGTIENQKKLKPHENKVLISRVARNRTFYYTPDPAEDKPGKRKHWYGKRMKLKDPDTHRPADDTQQTQYITYRGRHLVVNLSGWHNMRMKGKKNFKTHKYPFTLVKVEVHDEQGNPVFRPLWLMVHGKRRAELSLVDIYKSYRQRYDLEHFFRFGKQKLLMDSFQTPDTQHEENWWSIVKLSYLQLFLSKELCQSILHPWERYQEKKSHSTCATPSQTIRDLSRILHEIGTPARAPTLRGNPQGRAKDTRLAPRKRYQIVIKSKEAKNKESDQKLKTPQFEKQPEMLKPANFKKAAYKICSALQDIGMSLEEFAQKTAQYMTG